MNTDFYQTVLALKSSGSSFVTATVVSRRAPVSSHLGDRALIFADGRMQGFVGGSCSREIVRKQALEALNLGKPRLVLIRSDASFETMQHASDAEGIVVPMTCASEGAVDVYLEPHSPVPLLLIAGFTPVAQAVARMAILLEYNVIRIVTQAELRDCEPNTAVALPELPAFLQQLSPESRAKLAAVVATQGHYDEPVLEALLLAGVGFISLLASRKRAVTVRELLELQGVPPELIASIRNPAGLDINAKTPAEVAVSILAEIIKARDSSQAMFTSSSQYQDIRRGDPRGRPAPSIGNEDLLPVTGRVQDPPQQGGAFAISPVDGERIEIASALHFAEYNGLTYYFTCANCKRRFLKDPQKFLTVTA
jgi:xanthine dehydrogenase accessory factor